jgi:arylsulfatase A-like enzyme
MPEYYKNLYRPEEIPLGPSAGDAELQRQVSRELAANNFPAASGVWGMGSGQTAEIEDQQAVREFLAPYYGMVANVDHNLGIILNWLDRKGLDQDTLVIFLSDHGDMAGEHGYRCGTKKTAYRQAAQVPLLIRYPRRFPAGLRVPSLVDVAVDTMPTILDLCGIPIPDEVQGTSFLPLLEGKPGPVREAVYYEVNKELEGPERFPVPERGVRTPEWLYVRTQEAPKLLYDLKNDPDELRNLVAQEEYRPELERLDKMLQEHMARTGDDWSAESVFPSKGFLSHEDKTEKQKQLLAQAEVEP